MEWSITTDCKSVGRVPTQVRILPPPPSLAIASFGGQSPQELAKERVFMYYVYILLCNDGLLYTGCTNNLIDRLSRHQTGQVSATVTRRPIRLISYVVFKDKYKAYDLEKYLKSGSGRAFVKKHLV